ncbi:MAG TPA: hypothetical protein VMG81_03780 [Thermoplasmata archaeon]|nr:hypothetical protein [Thermoplasmata archaeon]
MDFLEEIVRETRAAVEDPSYARGLPARPLQPRASLAQAIRDAGAEGALVVEHKRVSPGASSPRLPRRSMADFVRLGEAGRATAFSCLATRPRFEGSPGDVADLCARTARPVLFKEFVIDPVQLQVAARAGASAVLLLARLSRPAYGVPIRDLATEAHALGLEVLLELHERTELSLIEGVAADVYGVNTRNLATLALDRAEVAETLRRAAHLRPMLGLSGVDGPEEARRFWALGVDGLLVGTGFAQAQDPVAFLDTLRRPTAGRP